MDELFNKKIGPLSVGMWTLLVGGGAVVAFTLANRNAAQTRTIVDEVPVPVGAVAAVDNAPLVMSPVVRIDTPGLDALTDALGLNTDTLTGNTAAIGSLTDATEAAAAVTAKNTTAVSGNTSALQANTSALKSAPAPAKASTPAPAPARRTYTIKSGDTLSGIAKRYTGSATRWPELYRANASKIDAEARRRGKSGGGHWIFPGTVLTIPW